jgi:hypothetical protein
VCYACAGFAWGGRDHLSLPAHCVSVANFPEASEEQMDNYRRPADLKIEVRPRHPSTAAEWLQAAKRECHVFSAFYGEEHFKLQYQAAEELHGLHTSFRQAWPLFIVFGVWAELRARYCEEIRMIRRRAMHMAGEETLSFDRLRFILMTPGEDGLPWLKLPRTFDLYDPEQYFITDIKYRHDNLLTRTAWAAAFRAMPAPCA